MIMMARSIYGHSRDGEARVTDLLAAGGGVTQLRSPMQQENAERNCWLVVHAMPMSVPPVEYEASAKIPKISTLRVLALTQQDVKAGWLKRHNKKPAKGGRDFRGNPISSESKQNQVQPLAAISMT